MNKNIPLVVGITILFLVFSISPNILIRSVKADLGDVVHSFDSPGDYPVGIAWDGQYIWNVDFDDFKIYKLNPIDGNIVHKIDSPTSESYGLAWKEKFLWLVDRIGTKDIFKKINPSDGKVVDSFESPTSNPFELTWDEKYIWYTDYREEKIFKIDLFNGSIEHIIPAPEGESYGITWDGVNLWVVGYDTKKIYKLDPSDGNILDSFISPGNYPRCLAWDGQYLWHTDSGDDKLYQIDVNGNLPPDAPNIDGPTRCKKGVFYDFTFNSLDPNGDDVYYEIVWGDGQVDPWDGPHDSNTVITRSHKWERQGTFIINARAKDVYKAISDWSEFMVEIPRTRTTINIMWFEWFLECFPLLEKLLNLLK